MTPTQPRRCNRCDARAATRTGDQPAEDTDTALRAERDTLRGLLDDVLAHVHLVNRLDESIAVLPGNLTARIIDATK